MPLFDFLEAQERFADLLDLVEQGEEVIITRQGETIARLIGDSRAEARARRFRAAQALMQLSRGITTGGISIKAMIEEGRE